MSADNKAQRRTLVTSTVENNTELRDQLLEKELLYVDLYLTNLQAMPAWRLFATASLARDARNSLRKCGALIGYTGEWWRDAGLYLASSLPLLLPINFAIPTILFGGLVAVRANALSTEVMRPVVIEKTVEVPFLYFFSIKKKVSETVMVPEVQALPWIVSNGLAFAVLFCGLLLSALLLKYLWLREIRYRRERLVSLWRRTL